MIGQIQIVDVDDIDDTEKVLYSHRDEILRRANEVGGSIIKRGGGAVDIEVRSFADTAIGHMVVLHLLYDTRDAMGANAVNTAVEYLAPYIEEITSGRVNLRILSNLTDRRKAYAEGTVLKDSLATDTLSGEDVVDAIIEAGVFAEIDPYRATTHNKGIMNGIDAVLMATGNDWRAVESGAHAFAARSGSYTSLTQWTKDENGDLHGKIELPLAVGIVGGATRVHPNAQIALQILGVSTASELAEVIATVGLAQNFAAIRALATDGIQHGHMRMHARQLAVAAGADVDMVSVITQRMINEKNIRLERAKQLVAEYREGTE
jgi:hydroxymethylglutaryl-CoA reductase